MNGKVRALVGATGVSAVVAAVALSGGTSAYYYDAKTITGNTVASCGFGLGVEAHTIKVSSYAGDLGSAGSQSQVTDPTSQAITIEKYQPGDVFETDYDLTNTNSTSCTADLWADVSHHENWNSDFAKQLKVTLTATVGNTTTAVPVECKNGQGDYTLSSPVSFSDLAIHFPCRIQAALPGNTAYHLKAVYGMDLGDRGDHQEIANGIAGTDLKFNVDFALVQQGVTPAGGLE